MTAAESKFVEAKLQGKSNSAAAAIANPKLKPSSLGNTGAKLAKKPEVRAALAKAMAKYQITIDRAVKPIHEALDATKVVGVGEYADTVPDHAIRLKASNMSMDLLGIKSGSGPSTPVQPPMDGAALLEALQGADFVKLQQIVFGKSD